MKYVRDKNRIYTFMDFEEGEEIEFFGYPSTPSSKAKGYVLYESKRDGRVCLLTQDDIKRCQLAEKGGAE